MGYKKLPLNVTVDADIRVALERMRRKELVNISATVNHLLRPHFKKANARRK